jgi:hypothetical protein
MERSLVVVSILLLIFFTGIPAWAAGDSDLKPAIVMPDPLQTTSKALWTGQEWLDYGQKVATQGNLAFTPFEGIGIARVQSDNEAALQAYNEGLKKAGDDKKVASELYAAKAHSYEVVGAPGLAIEALARAGEAAPDYGKKVSYLEKEATLLREAGRTGEADAVSKQASQFRAMTTPAPSPLPVSVIVFGLVAALLIFASRKVRDQ